MDEHQFGASLRRVLTSGGGPIPVPRSQKQLAYRLKQVSPKPAGHVAHHDFIWSERKWFADHGIDGNDAAFGRWVPEEKHKEWHGGPSQGGQFNQFWIDIKAREPSAQYTVGEMLDFLEEARQLFPLD